MKKREEQRELSQAVDEDCVLIIDDDQDLCGELAEFVEGIGLKTVLAHDGVSGLGALNEYVPKVALIDVQMPAMNGIELVRKAREAHPEVSLVLMSGADKSELEKLFGDEKRLIVLSKPLPLNDLGKFLRLTFGLPIWSSF
jgi:DNA-binding response OmpR family regulator